MIEYKEDDIVICKKSKIGLSYEMSNGIFSTDQVAYETVDNTQILSGSHYKVNAVWTITDEINNIGYLIEVKINDNDVQFFEVSYENKGFAKFYEYFYSKREIRNFKLKAICT